MKELRGHCPRLLAVNGQKTCSRNEGSDCIELCALEHVVVAYHIMCPNDVLNEVEFLTRASHALVKFSWRRRHHRTCDAVNSVFRVSGLRLQFCDEMSMWDHFVELPGGVVLLNTNTNDIF
jgi:hypothetical protein